MSFIIENIVNIKRRIRTASEFSGRNPNEIKLLLATKTVLAQNIITAIESGETLIGENKIQELKGKYEELKNTPHQTNFIGHLQTNKIKEVIKYADCIQSIDRLEYLDFYSTN